MDKIYPSIKEHREGYFVEYYPPQNNQKFATLNLTFIVDFQQSDVARIMESELILWLGKFPIPVFVSAFDRSGMVLNLDGVKPINHLIGFFDSEKNISMYWRLLKNSEIPNDAQDIKYIDKLFSDFPCNSKDEFLLERRNKRNKMKTGFVIVFLWLVVIPVIFAVLENYSELLSIIVMFYSIFKGIKKGLELLGKWPVSKKAKEKKEQENLKNHYYYHCQKNPEGFNRLKRENFEKEERENNLMIYNSLKAKQ